MLASKGHSWKAVSPIVLTEEGIVISVNEVQLENESLSISITVFSIITDVIVSLLETSSDVDSTLENKRTTLSSGKLCFFISSTSFRML